LPLSRMAAFWIQNAAMRDNICRDRTMIAVLSRHNTIALFCFVNALPPTQCAPPLCLLLHHLFLHARRGIIEGMGALMVARRRPCRRVIAQTP
jgi:hypothetical protein